MNTRAVKELKEYILASKGISKKLEIKNYSNLVKKLKENWNIEW